MALVANGRTLQSACKEKGITLWTFYALRAANGVVAEEYARARDAFHEVMEDTALEIADDPNLEPHDKRIRIEARHKHLAANKRDKWGTQRVDMTVTNQVDVREAIRLADAQVLRLRSDPALPRIPQVIDAEVISTAKPTDKQSVVIAPPPADTAPGLFD